MTSTIHYSPSDISNSNSNSNSNSSTGREENCQRKRTKQHRTRRNVVPPSFHLYRKPKTLTPQRCHRIVKYARKRLRGQDNNCQDPHDNVNFDVDTQVLSHSDVELGDFLGKGAFSSVYAINSINSVTHDDYDDETDNTDIDNTDIDNTDTDIDTERMVVKFLRTRLYDNHGLFAASAADLVKEGNILSSLSHTNVIRLHAVSSLRGLDAYASGYHDAFFLVLERLECTLTDRLYEWQSLHTELYYFEQLDEDYDPVEQFVDSRIQSSTNGSSSSSSSSSWRQKLSRLRSSKRSNIAPFIEDSDRTTATHFTAGLSCDGSIDDSVSKEFIEPDPAKTELLSERVDVTLQLADALAYLHKHNVIHRDLKPDNIGFDADGVLKVFDFDIARVVPTTNRYNDNDNDNDNDNVPEDSEDSDIFDSSVFQSSRSFSVWNKKTENEVFHMTQKVGSPRYMSPECARREPYNLKADVYSYALLAHQILTLQKPYDDITDEEHDELVFYKGIRPHIPIGLPSTIQELLRMAWSKTVSKRPTMEMVRRVLSKQSSEILRLGTLERTSPSVPLANTTGYVWSCSFEAISDNNQMLRKIQKKQKQKQKQKQKKKNGKGSSGNNNTNNNNNNTKNNNNKNNNNKTNNNTNVLRSVFQKSKSSSLRLPKKAGLPVSYSTSAEAA